MPATCAQIQDLVVRIQADFLEQSGLALTLEAAARRFGVDQTTSDAVLTALVEENVLIKDRRGAYVRLFPRLARRSADGASAPGDRTPSAKATGTRGLSTHAA